MDGKSEKIADLAGMFEDMDIIVIEEVLEMCKGKVNTAAGVLLKMKEESAPQVLPSVEKKESILNDHFLELDDNEAVEEKVKKEVEEVAKEDYENEVLYQAEIQEAIRKSIQEEKKKGSVQEKARLKEQPKSKKIVKSDKVEAKNNKLQKNLPNKKTVQSKDNKLGSIEADPDEEIIQFIFGKNQLIRGEYYSDA